MIAYFDCFSGISGDMIVGAFLDAGVPFDWLSNELKRLPIKGFEVGIKDVKRGGIGGKKFKVEVKKNQVDRNLKDIEAIIEKSPLTDNVKTLSIKVFERLAGAEAKIHKAGVDKIHFHEIGGIDSIVDVVAASLSLSYLKVDRVYSSKIPFSKGVVSCSHGVLPLPAPAVTELLKGVPVYQSDMKGELVTPTGAAFVTTVSEGFGTMPPMKLKGVGYGAGERENEGLPNLLRVMIGEEGTVPDLVGQASCLSSQAGSLCHQNDLEIDTVTVIETNIDDMNPEFYEFVMEKLFDEGALDVSFVPIYMKKDRPGTLLKVICQVGKEDDMAKILLKETSTIGVRYYMADRLKLPRESVEVETRYGRIRLKVAKSPWGDKVQPEYGDCKSAAFKTGVPIREIYRETVKIYEKGKDG